MNHECPTQINIEPFSSIVAQDKINNFVFDIIEQISLISSTRVCPSLISSKYRMFKKNGSDLKPLYFTLAACFNCIKIYKQFMSR